MCVYIYIFFFNFKYKISTDPEWQSSYYFCSLCMSLIFHTQVKLRRKSLKLDNSLKS